MSTELTELTSSSSVNSERMSILDEETRGPWLTSTSRTPLSYEARENLTIEAAVEPGFLEDLRKKFRELPEWLHPDNYPTITTPKGHRVRSTTEVSDLGRTSDNPTATIGQSNPSGAGWTGNASDVRVDPVEIPFDWPTFLITFVIGKFFCYIIFIVR